MISGRKQMIERAMLIISLFQSRDSVTIQDVADHLDCAYSQAWRWVQDMSRVYPVYESGKIDKKVQYSLLEDK